MPVLVVALWAVALLAGFGLAAGIEATRRAKLPACFAPPLVFAFACLAGYIVFTLHLVHPYVGRQSARACFLLGVMAFAWQCWSRRGTADSPLALLRQRDVWAPILLAVLVTSAYVLTLYARDAPVWRRFWSQLPPDLIIPDIFGQRLSAGITPADAPVWTITPWRSSDRPPLQAGLVAASIPLRLRRDQPDLHYEMLATVCQMGWVLALFTLARVAALTRRQTTYVLIASVCSGFFLLHSLYFWPKLLAAWLFLTALALILHAGWTAADAAQPRSPLVLPLAAGLIALAVLAHGGIVFSVLTLPVLFLSRPFRRAFGSRDLAIAALIGALLMAPWIAYQKYVDPPGTGLTKLHLAGVDPPDDRGVLTALRDEYGKLSLREIVARRLVNLRWQVWWRPAAADETLSDWIRRSMYFHHSAALDVLCVGLVALLFAGRRQHRLRVLLGFAGVSLAVWIALIFTAEQAPIHHGSYATTALLVFCGAAALAELAPAWRRTLLAAHVALFAWIWLIVRQTAMAPWPMPWRPMTAALAALAFVAVGLCAWRLLAAPEDGKRVTAG